MGRYRGNPESPTVLMAWYPGGGIIGEGCAGTGVPGTAEGDGPGVHLRGWSDLRSPRWKGAARQEVRVGTRRHRSAAAGLAATTA